MTDLRQRATTHLCGLLPPFDEDPSWQGEYTNKPREAQIAQHEAEWEANKSSWTYTRARGDSIGSKVTEPFRSYFRMLRGNFGDRFVIMLCSVYFGVKGFLFPFGTTGLMLYFRAIGLSSTKTQAFYTAAMMPWSLKALFGSLADSVPLLGFTKRSYIMIASLLGSFGVVALAVVHVDCGNAELAVFFFLMLHFELSIVDLLTEGKYAELMALRPKTGGALVSWVWGIYQLANLASSSVLGPLADSGDLRPVFWIALPFTLQVAFFTYCGCFPERKAINSKCITVKTSLLIQHKEFFILALLMAVGSVIISAVNLSFSDNPTVLLSTTLGVSVVLCTSSLFLLPRKIALCNLYMFISSATYVQINSAVDFWYLAEPNCVADGPNFSTTYYVTYSSFVQAIAGVVGVAVFQLLMKNWHFRPVFWVTTMLRACAAAVDLIIIQRWNVAMGISDHVMYMFGFNIIYQVTYMMDFMPGVVLTSKLCPKEIESTVYALLAGFSNFGQTISQTFGTALLSIFEIDLHKIDDGNNTLTNSTSSLSACSVDEDAFNTTAMGGNSPCSHDNLWLLVVVAHMLLPLISVPFTFVLIPNMRMTDKSFEAGARAGDSQLRKRGSDVSSVNSEIAHALLDLNDSDDDETII